MRAVAEVIISVVMLIGAVASAGKAADTEAVRRFEDAVNLRTECFDRWETELSTSSDSVENVADAVLHVCKDFVAKADLATKEAMNSVAWSDIKSAHQIMKDGIRSRLVVRRAARSQVTGETVMAAPTEIEAEPRTREGKLARCDREDASWREWVAERGHVRVDQIEEHEGDVAACKIAAAKLPTAADFHSLAGAN